MALLNKIGFWFFIAVIVFSVATITYVKDDSFFGLNADTFSGVTLLEGDTQVFFCPEDNCAQNLIERIDLAKETINIAIYSFTNDDIADALIRAKARGVEVKVVFDYVQSSSEYSDDEKLIEAGIEIKRRNASGSMHNKFAVIDAETVATGSFNYSQNADQKNDENLLFIKNAVLAQKYSDEFNELWQQSD